MTNEYLKTPEMFFLKLPLYKRSEWIGSDVFKVVDLLYFHGTIDSFCNECGKNSTFKAVEKALPDKFNKDKYEKQKKLEANITHGPVPNTKPPKLAELIYEVIFKCSRDDEHLLRFIYFVGSDLGKQFIEKVGQYPSYATLDVPEFKKYKPIITNETYLEFTKAVGLASHGIGIGAFVYLRRIFENLLEEAISIAKDDKVWDIENDVKKISEKIKLLKDYLPAFLYEHSELYGILSKGIHELNESECLEYFEVVKSGIELILSQKLDKHNTDKKLEAASKAIKTIASKSNEK